MKIVESILTKNPCYTAGRKIAVRGLMLHSVGCPQPDAAVFINSWNQASYDKACVHGVIDGNDGIVYQTLPWDHRGWHCGAGVNGSANNTHIGVEMCEPACIRYAGGADFTCADKAAARAVAGRTYEAAVELFAVLCQKYGLDPVKDGVVISHREGHSRGIASNHGDPEHLWSQLGMGYTMDGFRADVKTAMGGTVSAGMPVAAVTPVSDEGKIWEFLYGKIGNAYGTAGLMGELYAESGLRADNLQNSCEKKLNITDVEYTRLVDGNNYPDFINDKAGYGLAQWTYWSRKKALLEFAKGQGKSIGDLDMQLDFLWGEMQGYKEVLAVLKAAKSVREASDAVLAGYEKPADQGETVKARRAGYGRAFYEKYACSGQGVSSGGMTNADCPFLVRVGVDDLNIRKGAGTNTAKTGKYTGKGVFTVVEVRSGKGSDKGWGKLKSGAGWIALSYCERV